MSKINDFHSAVGEKDITRQENKTKTQKGKKRNRVHLSFRIIIIAMILALLFLLNWDGLHFGGKLGELMGESQQEESSSSEKDTTSTDSITDSESDSEAQVNLNIYVVTIREEKIFVFENGADVEVDQAELAERLTLLTTETVVLQDDVALNKIYKEVKEIIVKAIGINTKLTYIEK